MDLFICWGVEAGKVPFREPRKAAPYVGPVSLAGASSLRWVSPTALTSRAATASSTPGGLWCLCAPSRGGRCLEGFAFPFSTWSLVS